MVDISRERVRIIHAYRNLWDVFQKIYNGVPRQFKPRTLNMKYHYNGGNGLLSTNNVEPLILMGWPKQSNNGYSLERIDICIEVNHKICGNIVEGEEVELILAASRVKVTYLQHVFYSLYENDFHDCHVIEVVHYDLAENTAGHPIFHAQFSNDPINGNSIKRKYVNQISRMKQLRIATPPMDLQAILFGLVADHVPNKLGDLSQSQLWENAEQNLPSMPCYSIRDQINGRMKNIYWYPI